MLRQKVRCWLYLGMFQQSRRHLTSVTCLLSGYISTEDHVMEQEARIIEREPSTNARSKRLLKSGSEALIQSTEMIEGVLAHIPGTDYSRDLHATARSVMLATSGNSS